MPETNVEEPQSPERYQELIYKLTQAQRDSGSRGMVTALVSPHPGSGVTYVARTVSERMNAGLKGQYAVPAAVTIECASLSRSGIPFGRIVADQLDPRVLASEFENGFTVASRLRKLSGSWVEDARFRAKCLEVVRTLFKFVLIDCPSLKNSADICALAPIVDSVIIVVEADKTTRRQIEYLNKTIQAAGGQVLGYILNKRTYPIPESLYRILERGGVA